jgi:tripartite-type tricarboxylate transporter receptor subunit TctC
MLARDGRGRLLRSHTQTHGSVVLMISLRLLRLTASAVLTALPCLALAQSYPTRTVTIVVPYAPGGQIDLVARIIQPKLQAELGQNVVIDNKSGAGGNVGAEFVAAAQPDGYVLLLANPSLAISPHMYKKLNYRPLEDFAYIGQYGRVPNVLVVNPSLPVKSVAELIAYLKARPGQLNYGSPGVGTSPQLSMELFKAMTGTFVVHIPFRGNGPATSALLSNETQLMVDNLPPQVPFIKSGKTRALAVTSQQRSEILPDVPTLDESGLKGYDVSSWFGLAAPARVAREVVTQMNAALRRTVEAKEVRDLLVARGAQVMEGTPEEFTEFVKAETARWGPIIQRAGIVAE